MTYTPDQIRALAAAAGSREKLARCLGVSANTVYRWCRGEHLPNSQPVLDRLAEVAKELNNCRDGGVGGE